MARFFMQPLLPSCLFLFWMMIPYSHWNCDAFSLARHINSICYGIIWRSIKVIHSTMEIENFQNKVLFKNCHFNILFSSHRLFQRSQIWNNAKKQTYIYTTSELLLWIGYSKTFEVCNTLWLNRQFRVSASKWFEWILIWLKCVQKQPWMSSAFVSI